MHEHGGNGSGNELVAAKVGGRGHTQINRQEVEDGIRNIVDDLVLGALFGNDAQGNQHSQHGLDHAGGGKGGHQRGEHLAASIKEAAHDAGLLGALGGGGKVFRVVVAGHGAAGLALVHQLGDDVVDVRRIGTNDDLGLGAYLHHLDDAGHLGKLILFQFVDIVQCKTQTGGTVRNGLDVFCTANKFDTPFSKFIHKSSSFSCIEHSTCRY